MNIPLKLSPVFKDYIWGGTKLRTEFGKNCSFEKVAESWELACHKDGNSVILNGPFKGKTLSEYIEHSGSGVLGTACEKFEKFPVLVKLIDAADNLSVQVHPDDDYAMKNEGEYGKTEMWYVIDCEENSSIIFGFDHSISGDEFARRIRNNTLTEVTHSVPVKKGDVFFIQSGTLHAIGKGIMVAEIQQNSNTTYRVYDYDRKDSNGNSRELHIEKACEVTVLEPADTSQNHPVTEHKGYKSQILASCSYFTAQLVDLYQKAEFTADGSTFVHILLTEGSSVLKCGSTQFELVRGDSVFIPADCGTYSFSGNCRMIRTYIE